MKVPQTGGPGRDLPKIRKAAMSLRSGGVGSYPSSDFVHVDVGPVLELSGDLQRQRERLRFVGRVVRLGFEDVGEGGDAQAVR